MLVSGFVDGKLIYIIEFPFFSEDFVKNLEKQLIKRFPDGDKINNYLRGASFNFNHFTNSEKLRIVYLLDKSFLLEYKEYINYRFYLWLETKAK